MSTKRKKKDKPRIGRWPLFLALLASLTSIAAGVFLFQTVRFLSTENERMGSAADKLAALERTVAVEKKNHQGELEYLRNELDDVRGTWVGILRDGALSNAGVPVCSYRTEEACKAECWSETNISAAKTCELGCERRNLMTTEDLVDGAARLFRLRLQREALVRYVKVFPGDDAAKKAKIEIEAILKTGRSGTSFKNAESVEAKLSKFWKVCGQPKPAKPGAPTKTTPAVAQ